MNNEQLTPRITPTLITSYPDQLAHILNRFIEDFYEGNGGGCECKGNLDSIEQTTTSYDDGGVNIITAYLSDGTTSEFQIRNGKKGSQGNPGTPGADGHDGADGQSATVSVGTTTTLPAGSSATVSNVGTSLDAVFDFGIPRGADGQNGQDGQDGQDGFSPIATVSKIGDTATITITDENGTTTATVTDGADGAPGQAATVTAGTTTTLPAGSSATVNNSGTSSAAVFDFGIPKGDKGDTGNPGADGFSPIANVSKVGDTATITVTDENGTTTATVTDGTAGSAATIAVGTTTTLSAGSSATVTNSGTSSAAVFDFGIPKGDTGAAGQDGADGADGFSPIATVSKSGDTATITITDANGTTTASVTDGSDGAPGAAATITAGTTTTLSPGSSATVTNSGTSSAAVFDFGIPQGATGAPGADGADGADGFSPIATVNKVGDTATITITDQNGTTTASVSDGATGNPGPANTLSIGTVAGGATASATITGTAPNQTLNLVLPKGDTGNTGPKGDPGKGEPIGAVIPFSGELIPENYLICDGSAVSRATYAELFAVVGTRYGAGDGSTTFNLPDLRGKFVTSQDINDTDFDTVGETGGEKAHTLTVDEMPSHRHRLMSESNGTLGDAPDSTAARWSTSSDMRYSVWGNNLNPTYYLSEAVGGGQAHNNLPPYVVLVYIIKWKDLPGTIAEVKDSYSSSSTDVYSASYINSVLNNTNDILNLIYPVGSIYMSANNVSPANFIGGQWERIQDKFLLSAGPTYIAGDTGGSATHSHILSDNGWAKIVLKAASKIVYREKSVPGWQSNYQNSTGSGSGASTTETYGAELSGNTDDTTTLPPYLVVYVWKRTA